MEADKNTPHGPVSRPQAGAPDRPVQPIVRRPVVDGFVVRRPQTGMGPSAPSAPPVPAGVPVLSSPQPRPTTHIPVSGAPSATQPAHPQPIRHRPAHPSAAPLSATQVQTPLTQHAPTTGLKDEQLLTKGHGPREKNRTGHAGWVGFTVFILLGALLASPLLPGKVMDSLPFSSNTISTGVSSLDCLGKQGAISSSTKYDSKAGSPITYTSAVTTTQAATCDGQAQTAVVGQSSQFNVMGLAIDVLVALVVAIIVTRIWRLIFGEKRHPPRHRDE